MKKNHLIAFILTVILASAAIIGGVYAIKNFSDQEPEENNQNQMQSPTDEKIVEDYIKANISQLSPRDAVLGGTFYVTSVSFVGANTCIVNYEDGHIALTAKVEFEISNEEEVSITSFELDERPGSADSRINGNLTENAGVWQIVYEEPGKPALTAELVFDKNSLCQDVYEDKSCSPVYWEEGARAEIVAYQQDDKVLVKSLRIIGEASKNISGDLPISNFDECLAAGNEAVYPDCTDCLAYCETPSGERFEEIREGADPGKSFCKDQCGDGVCDEVVCMAEGCPCAENPNSCPEDCAK